MIKVRLAELMRERGVSYYRLAQMTGIPHSTFLRLAKGETSSINFNVLEAICTALDCTPNDLLSVVRSSEEHT